MQELLIKIMEFTEHLSRIPPESAANNISLYEETQKTFDLLNNAVKTHTNIKFPPIVNTLTIFFDSFLYYIDKKPEHILNMLKVILNNKEMTCYTKFFYYYQITRLSFLNVNVSGNKEIQEMINELYSEIFNLFKEELNVSENHIPVKERNKDIIFIITSQFLNLGHAPTKTTLDRAANLQKHFNKQIFIINAADIMPSVGIEIFYNMTIGNVIKEYSKLSVFTLKNGIEFPVFQPDKPMPNKSSIKEIIDYVFKYKPYFILNIGETIVSDLCSLFIPTIAQATVFSELLTTLGTFSVTANPKFQANDHTILTTFTFSYKPQTHNYKKSDFSLPEDKFLIIISGARLTDEVTYDFLNNIKEIFNYNAHIVFAGCFDNYEEIISKDNVLKENTTFLGFQEDMLAITELCDLYINPPRTGGGSSISEALSKGKPAITLNFGDCSIAAGKDFWVNTLDEMRDTIIKYITDKEFYSEMSKKALERNEVLTNTKKALEDIISSAENSPLWW